MAGDRIVTVRPETLATGRQSLSMFQGISASTAGSRAISMYKVVIPPRARAEPHSHAGHETAIYVLKGTVETFYGDGLRQSVVNGPGDFLFIPPDLPHMPVNISDTETAEAIVARTDPNDQESVVPYDPASGMKGGGP